MTGCPRKSLSVTVSPGVLLRVKSGATVPAGSTVDLWITKKSCSVRVSLFIEVRIRVLRWHYRRFESSVCRLGMGFDKPEPLVYATRNFGEDVCCVRIIKPVRLLDRHPGLATKCGQCPRHCFDVGRPVRNRQRILVQPGAGRRDAH